MQDYTVHCLSEAMSPITHASGSVGNESVIAREPIVTPKGKRWLPFLSGNALRHRCVREPGVMWLIKEWELEGLLTKDQLNFLMHGGNLSESTANENTTRIAEFNRLMPLMKCVGGCLPNQILKGSMHAWRGMLVCEENRQSLRDLMPVEWPLPEGRLLSAEHMIGNWQYTRGDAKKSGLCPATEDESNSNLMIFAGQSVNRGSMFYHGFQLNHVTEKELGALLLSLRLWQSEGGTIGGQAARGHGQLATRITMLGDFIQDDLVADYVAYVRSVKDDAVAWLHSVFPAVSEAKAAKPKRGAKPGKQETLL